MFLLTVEFAGAYFGVKWAFRSDRRWENRQFQKRVTEIVPHIYIELFENRYLLQSYQSYDFFYRNSWRFKTVYWDMFRSELVKWEEHDVVPLTRIYHTLTLINKHLDADHNVQPRDYTRLTIEVERLILHKLGKYEDWFENTPEAFIEFQKAIEQYRIDADPNRHLQQTLAQIKNRMKEKELILT